MSDAVARARELLAAATPGPWWILNEYVEPHQDGDEWHIYGRVGNCIRRVVDNTEDQMTWPDTELIAAAPTLLAELADEVDRLAASIQMIDRDALAEVIGGVRALAAACAFGVPDDVTTLDVGRYIADAVLAALPGLMGGEPRE